MRGALALHEPAEAVGSGRGANVSLLASSAHVFSSSLVGAIERLGGALGTDVGASVGEAVGAAVGAGSGSDVGENVGTADGADVGLGDGARVGEKVATLTPRTEMSSMPSRRRRARATIARSNEPSETAAETRASTLACALLSLSERGTVSSVVIETSGAAPSVPALTQLCSSNDASGSVSLSANP